MDIPHPCCGATGHIFRVFLGLSLRRSSMLSLLQRSAACNVSSGSVHISRLRFIGRAVLGHWYNTIGEPPFTKKVMLRTVITDDIVYAPAMMYPIAKDNRGTTLVCLACTHRERIQDFDG